MLKCVKSLQDVACLEAIKFGLYEKESVEEEKRRLTEKRILILQSCRKHDAGDKRADMKYDIEGSNAIGHRLEKRHQAPSAGKGTAEESKIVRLDQHEEDDHHVADMGLAGFLSTSRTR